jgi:hypothetical protein
MREFVMSIVSGLVVAAVSGAFAGRSNGGKTILAFLLGAAFVFAILTFGRGHLHFHR